MSVYWPAYGLAGHVPKEACVMIKKPRTPRQCVAAAKQAYRRFVSATKVISAATEQRNEAGLKIADACREYMRASAINTITKFSRETGIPKSTVYDCMKVANYIEATGDRSRRPSDIRRLVNRAVNKTDRAEIREIHIQEIALDSTEKQIDKCIEKAAWIEQTTKLINYRKQDRVNLNTLLRTLRRCVLHVGKGTEKALSSR